MMMLMQRGAALPQAPTCRMHQGGSPTAHRLAHSRGSRTTAVLVRASSNDGGGRRRVDWDREWSSYVNSQGDDSGASSSARGSDRRPNVGTGTKSPPNTVGGSSSGGPRRQRVPVDPSAKMMRDAIKREESFMLNAWTSDKFQGAGVAVAVLVLLALLLAAGPPPADTRCTLPWC